MPERAAASRQPAAMALGLAAVLTCAAIIAYPPLDAVRASSPMAWRILLFSALTLVALLTGAWWLARRGFVRLQPAARLHWESIVVLVGVGVPWAMVIVDSPHAAYFLITMFVLAQWLLPPLVGIAATFALALLTIGGQIVHHGWSAGSVIGPFVAALLIALFMAVLRQVLADSAEKSKLVAELREAQARLASSEREAGRLAERTRLGRELHDTVAQSLSSIQLLLHAAERAPWAEERAGLVARARAAAADSLAETRAFITELTPPDLAGRSLVTAIERVAARLRDAGHDAAVTVEGVPHPLPMQVETTVLRVAQEAASNVEKHARGAACRLRLTFEADAVVLEVDDDGPGFDEAERTASRDASGGFGVPGMQARAAELGGYAVVVADPGEGTLVSLRLPTPGGDSSRSTDATPMEAP